MKKKQYVFPHVEVAPIETMRLMDTSMTELPPQVGAPKRVPTLSNDSIRVF